MTWRSFEPLRTIENRLQVEPFAQEHNWDCWYKSKIHDGTDWTLFCLVDNDCGAEVSSYLKSSLENLTKVGALDAHRRRTQFDMQSAPGRQRKKDSALCIMGSENPTEVEHHTLATQMSLVHEVNPGTIVSPEQHTMKMRRITQPLVKEHGSLCRCHTSQTGLGSNAEHCEEKFERHSVTEHHTDREGNFTRRQRSWSEVIDRILLKQQQNAHHIQGSMYYCCLVL